MRSGDGLDGLDHPAVGLGSQHQAGPHGLPVTDDRAGPAAPLLATDVGAGQSELVTQEVDQQSAGLGLDGVLGSVDGEGDGALALSPAHAANLCKARATSVPATWRR